MTASGPGDHTGARAAGRPASTSEPAATAGAGPAGDAIPDDPQELAGHRAHTRAARRYGRGTHRQARRQGSGAGHGAPAEKPGRGCDGPVADRVKTSPPRQQLAGKTGPDHGGRGWAGPRSSSSPPEPARQAAARSARTAREQPLPYAAAAGAAALLLAGWLAGRRRR
jgi:hypothetical protein